MSRLEAKPAEVRKVSLRREMQPIVQQRLMIVMLLLLFGVVAVTVRIGWLTVSSGGEAYAASGDTTLPPRADIVDRNGVTLARTIDAWSIAIHPDRAISAPEELAPRLQALMPERSVEDYLDILNSDRPFVYLRRRALPELVAQVNALGEPAMEYLREPERLYPQTNLAAHVLGWVNLDGEGVTGMEAVLEERLMDPEQRGEPVALSVDSRVQAAVQSELATAMRRFNAIGAAGIVLDVHTGELLALTSLPNFNPNAANRSSDHARFNQATMGFYELGSTFKPITMAAAIEEGVVTDISRRYNAEEPLEIGRFTISDDHPQRRYLNVPETLVHSSNIVTARIADQLGAERMQAVFRELHFDDPVEFELPVRGRPIWPEYWARTTIMTAGYGHGIAITPLHLANSYATLVNGGVYRPLTLMRLPSDAVPEGERVFSETTSDQMRGLLRLIVQEGTGRNADADGYRVGGKTGTAEKASEGGYRRNALISTFAAAFPMDDPQYVIVIMLNEPRGDAGTGGASTAGWTAAPVVSRVVSRIGPLLGVIPSETRDIDTANLRAMLWRAPSERS
ncbi:peptidoglycan D,D-transpeptidase FtsI family protein [Parasphingopyxis lamellibrachiae]|uniref:Cell division protein FtsI (Penicillin-binding protein 3) n=1 Tax=Parasphingopyxis lamellibrachiae TaxID=680125 RepID=A0A3D9FF25_9SPHN|nr:penicillin-binding protein 2 [Parasphingopyxis lamellibrachiae]RED16420.1 cell division protein FtsI (penicillin-binding protein 3) [Parasphingopyxis lamellibrachiae]